MIADITDLVTEDFKVIVNKMLQILKVRPQSPSQAIPRFWVVCRRISIIAVILLFSRWMYIF